MKYLIGCGILLGFFTFVLFEASKEHSYRQDDIEAAHKDISDARALENQIREIRMNQQKLLADAEIRINQAREEK